MITLMYKTAQVWFTSMAKRNVLLAVLVDLIKYLKQKEVTHLSDT